MIKTFKPLEQLILYRSLLNDPVISLCRKIVSQDIIEDNAALYCEACYHLFAYYDTMPVMANLWQNYILGKIIADENPFALACEREESNNINPTLLQAGKHDLEILYQVICFDWITLGGTLNLPAELCCQPQQEKHESVEANPLYASALRRLTSQLANNNQILSVFISFYHRYGCGNIAVYRAFRWEGKLVGIACPDLVHLENLIGYENQKQALRKNTEAFLARRGGNHVLLFGDKGTGKSSSVKALLHEYGDQNLRMIELQRQQLAELNAIIDLLRRRSGFYIIFIDDLSFEDFEVEYKYLKSHIEGSLQAPAENVRLYVTSNRRHLIRENWGDRQHQDDVHGRETQQEKLSFADRFGLTLTYTSPLQKEYLVMVREMARQEGLKIDEEVLDRLAIQWELRYHGRSGRTARQFINDLKSHS